MGLATAKRLVQEGMDQVFITGRRKDALDAAAADIGNNVTAVQGDVAKLSDIDRLYGAVKKRGRKLDVIFANAGPAQLAPFGTLDEGFFDLHFAANVKGLFFSLQKGLPLLKGGSSIILNGSIADIVFVAPFALSTTSASVPIGRIISYSSHLLELRKLVFEACAVAVASGAKVHANDVLDLFTTVPSDMRSSMQKDVERGKLPELDAIAGPSCVAEKLLGVRSPQLREFCSRSNAD